MKDIKEKISVIIPVYNEGAIIYSNLKETKEIFDAFGCNYEIIICDDGSKDSTAKEIVRFIRHHKNAPVKIVRNKYNYGKGRALKKAFKYADGDYVIFLDSDLDLHPSQIPAFFDIMYLTSADIIIGSKRHTNSVLYYPLCRKIMSFIYFFMIKLLFNLPISDTQTGLKLFKRKVLKDVFKRILVKKFAFDLEILVNAHSLGYKIEEAPVIIKSQRECNRIGFNSIRNMIWDTLAIWYRMYILKYYDRIDYHRRKNLRKEFRRMRR